MALRKSDLRPLVFLMGGLLLLLGGPMSNALGGDILGSKPLFMNAYSQGRLVLASGKDKASLFLLNKRDGTLSRIDPFSGKSSVIYSNLSSPQDIAVGRDGNRILIDLASSRTLLVALLNAAGPPDAFSVGLNPGQIIRVRNDSYYLVARAVHILYALDPDRYHPTDWMAVGEAFRRVATDHEMNLWLPLERSGKVLELQTNPFVVLKRYSLSRCKAPLRVIPLTDGGFVAGCKNAVLRSGAEENPYRARVPSRFGHDLRDLVLSQDHVRLLAIFHHENSIFLYNLKDLSKLPSFILPFAPVRLYLFRNWPILFVVMNDPDHGKTWLSGYPLLRPADTSSGRSVPITSFPRKKT